MVPATCEIANGGDRCSMDIWREKPNNCPSNYFELVGGEITKASDICAFAMTAR